MGNLLWIAVLVLGVLTAVALGAIVVLFKKLQSVSGPAPTPSDDQNRVVLARGVTTWALSGIATLGIVIVIGAAVNAAVTHSNDSTKLFFSTCKYVLNTLLPVIAAWVGTVLAFYFGKENYRAAAESASALVSQLTPRQKLESKKISEAMLKIGDVTYFKIPSGTTEDKITLQTLIDQGYEKDKSNPRNRLPIVDSAMLPRYVLHRSTLDGFVSPQKDPSGDPPVTESTLSLKTLVTDPKLADKMSKSFFPIAPTKSLADAKDLLDQNPDCLDLLVTTDGTGNSAVIGWVTNVMVLNAAIL